MDLAKTLVRTISRTFYTTEHILVIDALAIHSTLPDGDLAHLLGMNPKALRKVCGKLKEDGLVSVQARGEKKEGAPPAFHAQNGNGQPRERLFFRDWYYINFHRAIDSIKYRLWKLNREISKQGASTTEKKDLVCPRCKSAYTELEVMDNIAGDGFHCHRCDHVLEEQVDSVGPAENENMKRMNDQLSRVLALMRQIDATTVPENDFDMALRYHVPIERPDSNPGARNIIVEDRKPQIASSKGMNVAPEKVSVNLTEEKMDEDKSSNQLRAERKEREAKQNLLPEWISQSTVNGDLTTVGAKEAADRRKRDIEHGTWDGGEGEEEEKKSREVIDSAAMDDYWKELQAAQERERKGIESGEEDDEDEDDFEDVDGVAPKRVKIEEEVPTNGTAVKQGVVASGSNGVVKDEAKVSDADDDDDELEFEDV